MSNNGMDKKTDVQGDDHEFEVSTVKLPIPHGLNHKMDFETCVFWDGGSRVIERYPTRGDAKVGHENIVESIRAGEYTLDEGEYAAIEVSIDD